MLVNKKKQTKHTEYLSETRKGTAWHRVFVWSHNMHDPEFAAGMKEEWLTKAGDHNCDQPSDSEFFQTGSKEGKIGDTRKGEDGMKILDSKFMKGFIKMADDGFQQGWHERNGGNLSYRLKNEEVEMIRPV